MASNGVSIEAKLDEKGVLTGTRKIKASLEDIKKADGSLGWDGIKDGQKAAKSSGDGFTVLKGVFANLATEGIMLATSAVKDFAAEIVSTGQQFETSMSKVSALSGATGDELGTLEEKARELGASTTFSASDAADALGYMALAGWDTADMLAGVGSVLSLAQAGEMDLAAASDLVTDYLSAFNMTASETGRMVDVLAYAQANANTTTEGLGEAFKNCAANANAAGLDIETTTAAISMMANQGLKGSEAGTALNAVMRDMTAKMQDGAIAIGDASVSVMDSQGNYRNFVDILADVEAATAGMGDAEKAAALQSTFTADSIKGLNLLLNAGADSTASFRDELYNCSGAAQDTADTMTDNLGGDLASMSSALEELQLKIYDGLQEPLRSAAQWVTGTFIPAISFLVDNIGSIAPVAIGAGTAIAVLAVALNIGSITAAASGALNTVKTAVLGLNAAMAANPIGVVIALVSGLVAAFMYLWSTSEGFRSFWIGLWEQVSAVFAPVIDAVVAKAQDIYNGVVVPIVTWFAGELLPGIQSAWSMISNVITVAVAIIASIAAGIYTNVVSPVISWFTGLVSSVQSAWDGIKSAIEGPINTARDIVRGAIDAIKGFFNFSISWPHIPMPHFSISPSGWQIGDLLSGSIPSLGISWYAKGGVFNGPSVIGVGEAGPEAAIPLSGRMMQPFAQAVSENMDDGGSAADEVRALRRELRSVIADAVPEYLVWNKREVARLVREVS